MQNKLGGGGFSPRTDTTVHSSSLSQTATNVKLLAKHTHKQKQKTENGDDTQCTQIRIVSIRAHAFSLPLGRNSEPAGKEWRSEACPKHPSRTHGKISDLKPNESPMRLDRFPRSTPPPREIPSPRFPTNLPSSFPKCPA